MKRKKYKMYLQNQIQSRMEGDKSINIDGFILPFIVTKNGTVYGSAPSGIFTVTPTMDSDGYLKVCLSSRAGTWTRFLHELVAEAYVPNPNSLPELRHIDGDKTNCDYSNLEWYDNNPQIFQNTDDDLGLSEGVIMGICYRSFVQKRSVSEIQKEFRIESCRKVKDVQAMYESKFISGYQLNNPDCKHGPRLKFIRPFLYYLIDTPLSDRAATRELDLVNLASYKVGYETMERHLRHLRTIRKA